MSAVGCSPEENGYVVGPAEFWRGDTLVARGSLDEEGQRFGEWTLYAPDGAVLTHGRYAGGEPEGVWRFPDGSERRWLADEFRFEPAGPFSILRDRALAAFSKDDAEEWRFELLDVDLGAGRFAWRAIWKASSDIRNDATCDYPGGLSPIEGVRLGWTVMGELHPRQTWEIYRPAGHESGCSSEAEAKAALAEAKAAFAANGLDPTREPPLVGTPSRELPWRATVDGHTVELSEIPPPSFEQQLTIPGLVGGSMSGRVQYHELRVDGHPAARFAVMGTGSNGINDMSVIGLAVDGDRAALLLQNRPIYSGGGGYGFFDLATPVFSLSNPVEPW